MANKRITKDKQALVLVRAFPTEQGLKEFLEEVPIPERVGSLLPDAQAVAEMLKHVPTVEMAPFCLVALAKFNLCPKKKRVAPPLNLKT